jgi:5-methylcytosine-specific restriction protein A
MPRRPGKPCSHPLCPNLNCEQHRRERQRSYDHSRGNFRQRGYSTSWDRLRAEYLRHHPTCVACGERAIAVDHVLPKVRGGSDDSSNLQALCRSCHSRKTVKQDCGFGNPVWGLKSLGKAPSCRRAVERKLPRNWEKGVSFLAR